MLNWVGQNDTDFFLIFFFLSFFSFLFPNDIVNFAESVMVMLVVILTLFSLESRFYILDACQR